MIDKDITESEEHVDLKATVGDLFDKIVMDAAKVDEDAVLRDAVDAILARETTRKAYVVDKTGILKGSITMETLMRHLSYRLGSRQAGVVSFFRFIRDIARDKVSEFMAKPHPIKKDTKLTDVVLKVIEEHLNDFPVVDDEGKLLGELNSLSILKVTKTAFKRESEEESASTPSK